MMNFKGTNTEWRVYGNGNTEVVDQHGQFIADANVSAMIAQQEKVENTKLIAAAPDLLRATQIGLGALEILSTSLKDSKLEANNRSIEIVNLILKKALE